MQAMDQVGQLKRDVLLGLLKERQWSRAELARRSGIGDYQIGRLLDGKTRYASARTVGLLLSCFPHHNFEDLFYGRDGSSGPRAAAA
jgi:hypothetical protein